MNLIDFLFVDHPLEFLGVWTSAITLTVFNIHKIHANNIFSKDYKFRKKIKTFLNSANIVEYESKPAEWLGSMRSEDQIFIMMEKDTKLTLIENEYYISAGQLYHSQAARE